MPTITTKELTTLKIARRHHHTVRSRPPSGILQLNRD